MGFSDRQVAQAGSLQKQRSSNPCPPLKLKTYRGITLHDIARHGAQVFDEQYRRRYLANAGLALPEASNDPEISDSEMRVKNQECGTTEN